MEPVRETLEALAEYVSVAEPDIEELLHDLGRRARHIVPELVGLSLTLSREGLTFTLVASNATSVAIDVAQYLDGGPCVEVAGGRSNHLEVTLNDDPLDERLWQLFSHASAALGVMSTLSLPVRWHGRLVGGANLYASTADAFVGRHVELAFVLGAQAAEAVSNADLSFSTRLEAAAAPTRLRDKAAIETAVGMLAAHRGITLGEARRALSTAAAQAGLNDAAAARVMIAFQRTIE